MNIKDFVVDYRQIIGLWNRYAIEENLPQLPDDLTTIISAYPGTKLQYAKTMRAVAKELFTMAESLEDMSDETLEAMDLGVTH